MTVRKENSDIDSQILSFGSLTKLISFGAIIITCAAAFFHLETRQSTFEAKQEQINLVTAAHLEKIEMNLKETQNLLQNMQMTLQKTNILLDQMVKTTSK